MMYWHFKFRTNNTNGEYDGHLKLICEPLILLNELNFE